MGGDGRLVISIQKKKKKGKHKKALKNLFQVTHKGILQLPDKDHLL